jgi:hypothetical protein
VLEVVPHFCYLVSAICILSILAAPRGTMFIIHATGLGGSKRFYPMKTYVRNLPGAIAF